MIHWKQTITDLKNKQGTTVSTDPERWNLSNKDYLEIYNIWKEANFNTSAVKWTNYYPEKDYSVNIVNRYVDLLNLKGFHRSWISRIDPGYFAPWHWDVDDNESAYLQKGNIKRFSVTIQDYVPGQMFILNDKVYTNCKEGDVIEWPSYKDWHSGINGAMAPKWMFHIICH